jgi:hypothetical protein
MDGVRSSSGTKKINKQEEEQKWVEKLIVGQEENSDLFKTTKGHFHLNWVLNCTGESCNSTI